MVDETLLERKCKVLLRDYGYEFRDGLIISNGIRGFTRDTITGYARSPFDAVEQLIPIICNSEFHNRYLAITKGNNMQKVHKPNWNLIAEGGRFSDKDVRALVSILVERLTQDEFLALDAIADGTDYELWEAIRKMSVKIRPELFANIGGKK